jgi:hypothetical protein
MRIDWKRIYFNAILGGMGGLVGWAAVALLGAILPLENLSSYIRSLLVGPMLGSSIGFGVGCTEGLLAAGSWQRMLKSGRYGAMLGAIGGGFGLLLAEIILRSSGGGVWSRAIGWAIFGAFIGISDGVSHRAPARVRYGLVGGMLGGLFGGATFEGAVLYMSGAAGNRTAALAWASATGLVCVGACIGAFVGIVEVLLRTAWLWFIMGRLEGQSRTLDSRGQSLGSSEVCQILLPGDATIASIHADIVFEEGYFVIRSRHGAITISRDGHEFQAREHVLAAGDRIYIGGSRMVFRTEEPKKRAAR